MSRPTKPLLMLAWGAASLLPASATSASEPPRQICDSLVGTHDGFFFTFWKDGGDACVTLGAAGSYSTRYDLPGRKNLVVGKGWRTGSLTRKFGYHATRFEPGSISYLALYGWSVDPLIEYYVVDNWGVGFKPPGHNSPVLGTVKTYGGTYEIYRTERVNQPSILGTQTFQQYWSVRTQKRSIGAPATITFANHVAAWSKLGMKLGEMDYQVLATEGYDSKGASEVTVWER
ncbi:MAG: glycoside hydrolase family 11 protein [Sphingomicrobium sp.]